MKKDLEMSDDELRVKVAELCGWTSRLVPSDEEMKQAREGTGPYKGMPGYPIGGGGMGGFQHTWWKNPKTGHDPETLPNYPADLNAMHEAEKMLTHEQMCHYVWQINRAMDQDSWLTHDVANVAHATARQRAEAFVETFNEIT